RRCREGDNMSTWAVGAVREAQARQRAAPIDDRAVFKALKKKRAVINRCCALPPLRFADRAYNQSVQPYSRIFNVFVCLVLIASCSKPPAPPGAETTQVRIPRGAGGVGFLPLLVMEKYSIIERQAQESGIQNLHVQWIDLGGPAVMNDALLSGA